MDEKIKEIHDLAVRLDVKVRALNRRTLKKVRLEHNIRGEDLSREMGCSHSYWSLIETGKVKVKASLISNFYLAITALEARHDIPRLQSIQPEDE